MLYLNQTSYKEICMKEWFMENYVIVGIIALCTSPLWLGIIVGIIHKIEERKEGRNANTK